MSIPREWVERMHGEALREDALRDSENALRDLEVATDLLRQGFDDFGLTDKAKGIMAQADMVLGARPTGQRERFSESVRATWHGESTFDDSLRQR